MTEPADFTERASVYSLFLVFAETELIETRASADEAIRLTNELDTVFSELGESHVGVRGIYDLTGFDANASVMIWLTSGTVDDLQWAKRQLSRTQLFGDTLIIESILTMGVSDLEDDSRSWISLAPVSPGDREDELDDDEVFAQDGEFEDPDIDNLDPEVEKSDDDFGPVAPLDEAAFSTATLAVAEPESGDDSENVSAELETTSLHAQIGVGPIRLFAVVEADEASELIGPSIGLLEGGLITVATPRTGRFVTPAELYEILR